MGLFDIFTPQQGASLSQFGNTLKSIGNPAAFQEEQKTKLMQLEQDKFNQEQEKQSRLQQLFSQPNQDPVATLQQAAQIDPALIPKLLEYQIAQQNAQKPDWKYQEIDGALVRYNANDPNAKPEAVYGGGQGGNGVPNEKMVKGEGELRKEFDNLTKDYRIIQDAYNKIQSTASDPSAAGDLSLIFSYMKLLDPASTVREGEFATAQNAAGVPVQIQNLWNRAKTGERLAPEQRSDFLRQSENLYKAQASTYDSGVNKYRGLASEYGYNPDRIVKPVDRKTAPQKLTKEQAIEELRKRGKIK